MVFFRRRVKHRTLKERMARWGRIFSKSLVALALAMPFVVLVDSLWYYKMFKYGRHLHERTEGMMTAAVIPMLCVFFGFLAAAMLTTVWKEYKAIHSSVEKNDKNTFLDLKEEQISPLIHVLMGVQAVALIACFTLVCYATALDGFFCITICVYTLGLYFVVVVQVDDPCHGLWFIKGIPPDWLEINVREWRQEVYFQLNGGKGGERRVPLPEYE